MQQLEIELFALELDVMNSKYKYFIHLLKIEWKFGRPLDVWKHIRNQRKTVLSTWVTDVYFFGSQRNLLITKYILQLGYFMKCSAFKWALRLLKGSLNNCQGRPKTNEVIHNPNY